MEFFIEHAMYLWNNMPNGDYNVAPEIYLIKLYTSPILILVC